MASKKELEKQIEELHQELKSLHGFIFALTQRVTQLENKQKVEYFK